MNEQKRRSPSLLFRVGVVLLFACVGSSAEVSERTPDQRAALAVLESACEALTQGNMEKLTPLYHDRFVGWDLAQPLPLARAAFMAEEAAFLKSVKSIESKLTPIVIEIVGDTAVVDVTYKNTVVMSDGQQAISTGRWSSTLVKQGGNTYVADK